MCLNQVSTGKVARKATQLGLLALLDALFGAARRFVFQGQLLQEAGREKRRRTDADAVKRGRPSVANITLDNT